MSPEAPLYEVKMEVLKKNGVSNEQSFDLRNGKVPSELLGMLRVQRVDPVEFVDIERAFSNPPVSHRNEMLVLNSLIGALTSMLERYPTTLEEDRKILSDRSSLDKSPKRAFAVLLRHSEKEILQNDIQLLRKMKSALKQ
jgi:hypothetical protein